MAISDDSRPREPLTNGLPPIAPDFVEQDGHEASLDLAIPPRDLKSPLMVGLGASAGGIQALKTFLKAMPSDSGMIFVVVIHLSPSHESTLANLLSQSTSMPVVQVTDDQHVQPNHVYVIPPGKYLAWQSMVN